LFEPLLGYDKLKDLVNIIKTDLTGNQYVMINNNKYMKHVFQQLLNIKKKYKENSHSIFPESLTNLKIYNSSVLIF